MYHRAVANMEAIVDVGMFFEKYTTDVKKKSLKDLRGKMAFREGYDYKVMREKV